MPVRNSYPLATTQFKKKQRQQARAEKRTERSELVEKHGRKYGRQLTKAKYASEGQKRRAQERTSRAEKIGAQGIETTQSGYAKRKQVKTTGSYGTYASGVQNQPQDFKTTTTIYSRKGDVKRTKKVSQVSPMQTTGLSPGTYMAKIEKVRYGKRGQVKSKSIPKFRKRGPNFAANTAEKIGSALLGAAAAGLHISGQSWRKGEKAGRKNQRFMNP